MNINFEYSNVKASERLEDFTEKKIEKLFNRYDFVQRADVFISKENTSSKNSGNICKIRLSAPGPQLFAESDQDSFESSIVNTVSDLERQLRKKKEKMNTH
ncbi:MAG: ribosome-associated translation inhibitor RaiA [Cellulophaga sp.]